MAKRFQFRLRTLLILVTLLAAQCAFVAWVARDRQRLIREHDDALRAAESAATEQESKASAAERAARAVWWRAIEELKYQKQILSERPGINDLSERRDMTK
jgi:hypothetical protein